MTRERVGVGLLLLGTAVAYLTNLSANGWANPFYSAAVQAGSVSWKAAFFGSSDAANSITVDKPPASLWPMELSVRLFGLNSWSIQVPQVLMGVASVALLYATVRRYFGHSAGMLAGAALAVTPVAVLMFRFNNPDALLVLLMIAAVWATLRAVEDGRTRWLVGVGVLVGVGFLTKQLQVMLIVPPVALTYLVAGPAGVGRRVAQLCASAVAAVAAAGWWIAAVELWPPQSRPWIGGSQDNSILELTLGYNGLGRINGHEKGSFSGFNNEEPVYGHHFGTTPGIGRLFQPLLGGQIAWLLPAALILAAASIILLRKVSWSNGRRALILAFGLWLLTIGGVFSYMQGIFHPYYSIALAPAIAALVGAGGSLCWDNREKLWVRWTLVLVLILTGFTSWMLLDRTPEFVGWLRWLVVALALLAAVGMSVDRGPKLVAALSLVAVLAGPVAYSIHTLATAHGGAIPAAGPRIIDPDDLPEGPGMLRSHGTDGRYGGFGYAMPPRPRRGGGLLDGSVPGPGIVAALEANADRYEWVGATVGSNRAAGYQLATRRSVMPIGGFNGTDPSPTLVQFQQSVAAGRIHYFIGADVDGGRGFMGRFGDMGGPPGSEEAEAISRWAEATFVKRVVDGVELYDLTEPKG